jgi:hypothetical protein
MRHFVLRAALLAALAFALPAQGALVTTHYGSDQEMIDIMAEPHFVAEGRIGNNALNGDFEMDIGRSTSSPDAVAQLVWPNGTAVPFTLTHDGAGTATFSMAGETLDHDPIDGFTDVFIRVRAVDGGTSIVVTDLVLDGEIVGDLTSTTGDGAGLDILRIEGGELGDGFTLTGTATLAWTGTPPQHSRLAFQLKIGAPDGVVSIDSSSWSTVKEFYR